MNYQTVLCLGDSQTFGARTYGCYPLYLAQILTERTAYEWRTINRSASGGTARDLWFRVGDELETIRDTYQACILIGTNDVGNGKDLDLFAEYYRQILRALFIHGFKVAFCGEIPPIHPDGHAFFARSSIERRDRFNEAIAAVAAEFPRAVYTPLGDLGRDCYEDPVHFNEKGNLEVAEAFAAVIINQ